MTHRQGAAEEWPRCSSVAPLRQLLGEIGRRIHGDHDGDQNQPQAERERQVALAGFQGDGGGHHAGHPVDVPADDHHRADFGGSAPESGEDRGEQREARVPEPSERSCSSYSCQASSIAWRESAPMIGRIRIACAKIIAEGVKRIPSAPRGPARESRRYTSSPTTTGGKPMSAFSNTTTVCRPRKRPTALAAPRGKPSSAAIATADRLTRKLSRTISISLASRPIRSASAALRASDMIRGQLDRGFPYVQLDCTRASPVERNRFDQGADLEPRRETELPRRARRNPRPQGRRSDSDRDIDDPAALVPDRGDSPRKNVLDADALRSLERDRNVAGPDAHAHRLADQGIDAGRRQRASFEGERGELVLHVLLDHLRVDHRAAFEGARA